MNELLNTISTLTGISESTILSDERYKELTVARSLFVHFSLTLGLSTRVELNDVLNKSFTGTKYYIITHDKLIKDSISYNDLYNKIKKLYL